MKCHRHIKIMISLCTTPRAESPSIFLEKSGRGRRLCSWPALSLIRRSYKNMDESAQFRTGRTGLPLMRMLNWRNCWLFSHPRQIVYNRSTNKSFKKLWNVLPRKLNWTDFQAYFKPISSLTEPQSRPLFNFLSGNDTFVLLATGHEKSLIYQICPAVARKLASTEKKFPSEPIVIVISPLISLIADQISSSVKWGWTHTSPQGVKLRLIQAPMRLNFSLWRPNPEN